ncbi:copper-translocating P-type ATPase [Arthrobacter sp. MYb227]|uniref:heavy metal translocating P-type ATPase n=1 Tax=Arthrobacter sp. MYb227 TaxID=1848601 RepID=UPI000CFAFCAC|nr:cation-translocating P-type ATPase [Arthrobacter sp. MYb227]PQZ92345.1 copper-translocating P-type ATPase [Arthrobacter sp. MYb227]
MTGKHKAQIAALTGALLLLSIVLHPTGLHIARDVLLFGSAVIAGVPTAIRAFQGLRMKAFSIDLLVTIAVVGALIIGEYVEAAVVSFLFIFGAWLEARTLEKTRSSLRNLVDSAPQEATVLRDGESITVPVDDIVEGDTLIIHSGGKVAVDGVIVSGRGHLVEAAITGESVPVPKTIGQKVYSGTLLDTGFLHVEAEHVGDDTTFAQIIELVEEAQETKTKAQRFLDKFANIYTPAIVVLSIIVLIFSRNIEFALTFLVIACPGALVISTPVSMVAGLGNGARHGVLLKGGDALERLSKIDTLVFDKTGTLTEGKPRLTEVKTVNGNDEHQILAMAAILETASEHPLGRTIVQGAQDAGIDIESKPHDVQVIKGGGIGGTVKGQHVVVGTRRVLNSLGVQIPEAVAAHAVTREREGNTVVFVVIEEILVATMSIADTVRAEVKDAITALRAGGIKHFYMLTGDNKHTAHLVAAQLSIENVHAELLPADKVTLVAAMKAEGKRVGMVGDGINDAPAIATADIGIAMGAGTDVSIQTADAILMGNRFDQLVHAVSLAKATVRNMKQNTFIAIGTVVMLLLGVLSQKVFMSTGMLVHEISVIVVILNAIRLVRFSDKKGAAHAALPAMEQTEESKELLEESQR